MQSNYKYSRLLLLSFIILLLFIMFFFLFDRDEYFLRVKVISS